MLTSFHSLTWPLHLAAFCKSTFFATIATDNNKIVTLAGNRGLLCKCPCHLARFILADFVLGSITELHKRILNTPMPDEAAMLGCDQASQQQSYFTVLYLERFHLNTPWVVLLRGMVL